MRYLLCDVAGHHFFVDASDEDEAIRRAVREGARRKGIVCVSISEEP